MSALAAVKPVWSALIQNHLSFLNKATWAMMIAMHNPVNTQNPLVLSMPGMPPTLTPRSPVKKLNGKNTVAATEKI
jgi:hypothetical protein